MTHSRRDAMLLIGAAVVAPTPALSEAVSTPIRIVSSINDAFIEPYYALERGLYDKAGLTVDLQVAANGGTAGQAVAARAAEIGLADITSLANAHNRGLALEIFAGGALWDSSLPPVIALCVSKNNPVRKAKDLERKTIGLISLRSINTAAVSQWAADNGADPSKIQFFETPFSLMTSALERGTIDAALMNEPFLSMNKASLRIVGVPHTSIGKRYYIGTGFGKGDWLSAHADITRSLAQTAYSAAQWANAHESDSAVILAKYSKLPVPVIEAMARTPQATSLEPALIQPVLDISWNYKLIDQPLKAADLIFSGHNSST